MKKVLWKRQNIFVENNIDELEELIYDMTNVVYEKDGCSELCLV